MANMWTYNNKLIKFSNDFHRQNITKIWLLNTDILIISTTVMLLLLVMMMLLMMMMITMMMVTFA